MEPPAPELALTRAGARARGGAFGRRSLAAALDSGELKMRLRSMGQDKDGVDGRKERRRSCHAAAGCREPTIHRPPGLAVGAVAWPPPSILP
uniref:Uncharacterized protein n=1 Tax=Setaria viridis TaxID=4556 RepID=A0A4U6T8I4_SETVI|nr:hypothetical protein SEVIR_9G217466v2 [Setaria viridis]